MGELASDPAAATWMGERLRPVLAEDSIRYEAAVRDLDSDRFTVRRSAVADLESGSELAASALANYLKSDPPLNARRLAEGVLAKLEGPIDSGNRIRELRAVEVLEWIGNNDSKRVLKSLAGGVPTARSTREAKSSLERLR
jgi:hypothetical protein